MTVSLPFPPDGLVHREGEMVDNEVFPLVHLGERVQHFGHGFDGRLDMSETQRTYVRNHATN